MVDCLSGECSRIEHLPFEVGSGEGADLRLNGQGVAERHCSLNQAKGHGFCLIRQEPNLPLVVDGEPVEFCPLKPDVDYTIRIGNHLLVVHGSREIDPWLRSLDLTQWSLHDSATNQMDGPLPLEQLCQYATERQRPPQTSVRPQGLTKGFLLYDACESVTARQAAAEAEAAPSIESTEALLGPAHGLTCPVCWLKFELGEIMHVATHDSLRGDPILGEDVQQRFLATRFNDLGQAL